LNPKDALEIVVRTLGKEELLDASDIVLAVNTVTSLVEEMCDEYYSEGITQCADFITTLISWADNNNKDYIEQFFKGTKKSGEVVENITKLKMIDLDEANNGLSLYIENLYNLGFEEDLIMEKFAQIAQWQNNNLTKKAALEKVRNGAIVYVKGAKEVLETLDVVGKIGDILKVLTETTGVVLRDYTVTLIKLNILIEAFENGGESSKILLQAAKEMRVKYEDKLLNAAETYAEKGIAAFLAALNGAWGLVQLAFGTVSKTVQGVVDLVYLNLVNTTLERYASDLRIEYIANGNQKILLKLEQTLHCIADCRAYMNDSAINLNKAFVWETGPETIDKLEYYSSLYHTFHVAIKNKLNP